MEPGWSGQRARVGLVARGNVDSICTALATGREYTRSLPVTPHRCPGHITPRIWIVYGPLEPLIHTANRQNPTSILCVPVVIVGGHMTHMALHHNTESHLHVVNPLQSDGNFNSPQHKGGQTNNIGIRGTSRETAEYYPLIEVPTRPRNGSRTRQKAANAVVTSSTPPHTEVHLSSIRIIKCGDARWEPLASESSLLGGSVD
ncbi:hypothetical protein J6590_012431 [Homalodisca vitripennis]|nr:hypothetical protein J6590_012431 [Homalodisca vitripennis]